MLKLIKRHFPAIEFSGMHFSLPSSTAVSHLATGSRCPEDSKGLNSYVLTIAQVPILALLSNFTKTRIIDVR